MYKNFKLGILEWSKRWETENRLDKLKKKPGNVRIKVTLRHFRITVVDVEK